MNIPFSRRPEVKLFCIRTRHLSLPIFRNVWTISIQMHIVWKRERERRGKKEKGRKERWREKSREIKERNRDRERKREETHWNVIEPAKPNSTSFRRWHANLLNNATERRHTHSMHGIPFGVRIEKEEKKVERCIMPIQTQADALLGFFFLCFWK